jgi:D-alanyl-D-alanine carboxypeptidase/D-alanyl-D-alanine-endopeptidase (penicillin-binding protein 4)
MLVSSPLAQAADDEVDEADRPPEATFATTTAAATPAGAPLTREALVARLKELVADPRAAEATVGVAIVDTTDGSELFASKADVPLIPASNMKLISTASALIRLGSSWRFQTQVGLLGDDLVVVAGGDPNLSGRFYSGDVTAPFRAWAEVLKQRGVKQIRGDLVIDDSLFEAVRHHPRWLREDLGTEWAAPVGALLFNDSCVDVYLRGAAEAGKPATVRLDPPTTYAAVANGVRTEAGKADTFTVALRGNPRKLTLAGTIRPNVASKVHCEPVDDPGLYAGTVIKETLVAAGLPIQGDVVRRRVWTDDWQLPEAFQVQVIHTSSLMQSITVANTRSQNLYAETILKTLAAYAASPVAGDPQRPTAQGSWTAGSAVAAAVLTELGLGTKGCVFDDGSGLSPANRLTAGLLANLLAKMATRPEATAWMNSLARYREAGGSLRSWPAAPALEGRVRGKSGKLTTPSSRCLSGYLRTRSGKTLAFSFLANNIRSTHYPVMQWMAQTLTELTRY